MFLWSALVYFKIVVTCEIWAHLKCFALIWQTTIEKLILIIQYIKKKYIKKTLPKVFLERDSILFNNLLILFQELLRYIQNFIF